VSIDPAPDSVASVPGAADGPFTVPEHLRAEQLQERMGIELLEWSREQVVGRMPVTGNRQPYGLLHGGASAVLAETLGSVLAASGWGLLRGDGSVLVLTGTAGEDRVAAGRRLLRTWLVLARHGLAVHPLSQLLDCPATADRVRQRARPGGGEVEPLAVFRAGRPRTEPVRSARLPVGG